MKIQQREHIKTADVVRDVVWDVVEVEGKQCRLAGHDMRGISKE
jgi:hypothetical protein